MNQTARKYAIQRIKDIAKTKLTALENEDKVLREANNKEAELTVQEMVDCLRLDPVKFTSLTGSYGVNVELIREFLNKPGIINTYSKNNSYVSFDSVGYNFYFSDEMVNRAKQIIAHVNVATDALMLGSDTEALKALEDFNSKIF